MKHSVHRAHVKAIAHHAHAHMRKNPETTADELAEHLGGCFEDLGISIDDSELAAIMGDSDVEDIEAEAELAH